ncbi:MAG: peptide chain release factor N(5)-glutamine methyltransferase [Phycisphaeraceae bacterium]|nr:peptide chain release factor N(5)-glutamine methyltransferase [Phycisphaerales bacterium]MCB9860818.1 peptide chain release factor N(5)-glutamine methyltransferase [Phycisphaeraceae bacterium]
MTTPSASKVWTSRELQSWMISAFQKAGVEPARLCAETLLCHVLKCDRLRLMMDQDRPANEQERGQLRELVARALKHEPVQYLVGHWPFYGVDLKVDKRALIPRPCTEQLVDIAINHIRTLELDRQARVLDMCTGSGCIAIAIAKQCPDVQIIATDIDADALSLARENVERCGAGDRVTLLQGDLYRALPEGTPLFDVLVSNPPYITDTEWEHVAPRVKDYEPTIALRGGTNGMQCVGSVIEGAEQHLVQGGLIVVEITPPIAEACLQMASAGPWNASRIVQDHDRLQRFWAGTRL